MALSEFRPENDFERVLSEAKQIALDIPELIDILSRSILYVPTRSAAQPGHEEFLPQLLPDGRHYSVVTFSSQPRAPLNRHPGGYLLEIDGRELVRKLPPFFGIALNPGYAVELGISWKALADYRQARKIPHAAGCWAIVVDPNDEVETLGRRIMSAMGKRQWSELGATMQFVLAKDNRVALLADLAGRLPGSCLAAFLLCGLPRWLELSDHDFRALYARCSGRGVAIYDLTRFLLHHGRANRNTLMRLCENFSEIEQIEQFRPALESQGDVPSPKSDRMSQAAYREYGISMENVSALRARFSS